MSNSLSPCTRSMYIRSFKATTMGVSLAHLINLCSCFLVDQSSLCPSWNQHESRFAVRHQNHQHEAASRLAQEDGQAILVADMIQCPDQKPSHPLRWKNSGGMRSEVARRRRFGISKRSKQPPKGVVLERQPFSSYRSYPPGFKKTLLND